MIEVIDNFLDLKSLKTIKQIVESPNFTWTKDEIVASVAVKSGMFNLLCDEKLNVQFCHKLHRCPYTDVETEDSPHHKLLLAFMSKLDIVSIISSKINYNPHYSEVVHHGFHIDNPFTDAMTAIYYINSNDGNTLFEDGTKVESVTNRLVRFPSSIKHTGSTCTNTHGRYVLNINYLADPNIHMGIAAYG